MFNENNLKVAVRVRPFNQGEKAMRSKRIISMAGNNCTIQDPRDLCNKKMSSFDYCYWSTDGHIENDQGVFLPNGPHSQYISQKQAFNELGRAVLENAWKGYNATLFTYGQTGSGKSYSMTGYGGNKGLVPMICEELFQEIKQHQNENGQFYGSFSMFEIYNEQVQDLLAKVRKPSGLRVWEGRNGFYVEYLKSVPCGSFKQLEVLLDQGIQNRSVATTNWNTTSNRSHMVISIQFQQVFANQFVTKHSEINLVDLAGSERQRSAGAALDRFNEARAINLSLTTLGNVISSLSNKAVGKRVQYIPYRNSVLTRLLSTALGGNSKTIMVTMISPADIYYDETMSTLRFAERAKNIQNRAVINESLTEQLLLDLKEDNTRLQARIGDLEKAGDVHTDEQGSLGECKTDGMEKKLKCSWHMRGGTIKDRVIFGSCSFYLYLDFPHERSDRDKIHEYNYEFFASELACIEGFGMVNLDIFTVEEDSQSMENRSGDQIVATKNESYIKWGLSSFKRAIVGGDSPVGMRTGDSVAISMNVGCVKGLDGQYVNVPTKEGENLDLLGYKAGQVTEVLVVEHFEISDRNSISSEMVMEKDKPFITGVDEKLEENMDPDLSRIFHDFIAIMPMVAQANQISEELNKGVTFELEVKHLTSTDAKGEGLEKEIIVKVTNKLTKQVEIWPRDKFTDQELLIEGIYMHFLENGILPNMVEQDPFWDSVEILHLGSAHVWLETLVYCIAYKDQVEAINYQGKEEAVIQIRLLPCTPSGNPLGEESVMVDSDDLLGKCMDFQMQISLCLGVKWIKGNSSRGVQIGFTMYRLPATFSTPTVWNNANFQMDYTMSFTIQHVTADFLSYLKTHAVVLELWGLQDGCQEMETEFAQVARSSNGSVLLDLCYSDQWTSVPEDPENCRSKLSEQLKKLEQEIENLRDANRDLKKENIKMQRKLERLRSFSSSHGN
ncbi:kinesin-like protein KIF28P [Stegostoma tigrinum]|uniref:kinesin-like protein KIF28P n=1 Tax=Stegostoma tigrinum TaxID=3053191 RepID=UPI0028700956|nr:kinesin-like protein KIF28P [Stegostoma tigrinum]